MMALKDERNNPVLRAAGWRSRGYLPHFDGRALPQFITLHLADSLPLHVIERWQQELRHEQSERRKALLRKRIEHYLDRGYGECFLKNKRVATTVQDSLLHFDGERYRLHAWVVMPNHIHVLLTRAEDCELHELLQAFKSYTAHEANKLLGRKGNFWFEDYFDRYIRNPEHFRRTVIYIENNPVKARLCKRPEDWLFSSAWFRAHDKK
jgi:REP element-mobilizing transposase RayT